MGYKHLTREQRYTIEALLQTPMSLREIGEVIGVSTGTVSREIRRNCDMRGYHRYRCVTSNFESTFFGKGKSTDFRKVKSTP